MTHRLLRKLAGVTGPKLRQTQQKPFEYLLVLDFEATCIESGRIEPQEIIEFPCMALSTKDWQVENVFHKYVRPRVNPQLTPFCVQLTGIMQEMVDGEPLFPEVLSDFRQWLKDGGYFEDKDKSAFVTTGDTDLKSMLPRQCAIDNLTIPEELRQWIDLKSTFSGATFYYPRNLIEMLAKLDLAFTGRLHSGIDDVANMVRVIQALQERHRPDFKITGRYKEKDSGPPPSGSEK